MKFKELNDSITELKSKFEKISKELDFERFVRIKSEHFSENTKNLSISKIFDGPLTQNFSFKSFQVVFNEAVYIGNIKFYLKGGLSTKKITIIYHGSHPSKKVGELCRHFLVKETSEIKVNASVVGLTITSNKPISEAIEYIEIYGDLNFDPEDFQDKLVDYTSEINSFREDIKKRLDEVQAVSEKGKEIEMQLPVVTEQLTMLTASALDQEKLNQEWIQKNANLSSINLGLEGDIKDKRSKQQVLETSLSDLQKKIESNRDLKSQTQREVDEILNKKSFYNVTLEGFKKETKKNFWINFVVVALLIVLSGGALFGVLAFYEHALEEIKDVNSEAPLYAIIALRLGAGIFFLTIFFWLFDVMKTAYISTLRLITDTRNIEAKLILAKNIAETVMKGEIDEKKRDYASFLSFVLLKNHFMNLSEESIAHDLEIDASKLSELSPAMPPQFSVKTIIQNILSSRLSKVEPKS